MKFGKICRAFIAVFTAVSYNLAYTFPHLGLYWLLNLRRRQNPAYRNGMTVRMTDHGERLFRLLCSILDVTIDFRMQENLAHLHQKPLIVLANHQSIMDIPLMFAVMKWLGLTHARWIMKQEIGYSPFGWFSREVHSAFVSRKNGLKDIEAVNTCGAYAQSDGAAVILFPEGTRFTRIIPGSGLNHLRPPKTGGFDSLRRHMPQAQVISITLCWTENGQGRHAARTLFDADGLVGKHVIIRAEKIDPTEIELDSNWLQTHWSQKDIQLENLA